MSLDPVTGAALIGGGASIMGGLMGQNSARQDRKMQKEFAQHGVRWRVADAEAAGIHPLAALGMPATQATPVGVGGNPAEGLEYIANKLYDAQMQEAVTNSQESKARAKYYNTLADDIKNKPKVTGGNLVGNEVIVPGMVQNKPQVLQTPLGTHTTGKAVPQERMEQEYGGVIGEGYGIIRAYDDFVRKPINRKVNKYLKDLKKKASKQKKRGQMNRRRYRR